MNEQDIIYKLALSFIPSIGAVHAKNLISYLGGIDKIFKTKKSDILKVPGIGEKRYAAIKNSNAIRLAEIEYQRIQKYDIEILFYFDSAYPKRLKQQNDCPLLIYTSGHLALNPKRTIAIIGTRSPSPYGQIQCHKIVEDLKKYDVSIISGLAYGIDTIAHRAAVKNKIPTIGILGNGLEKIYPHSNYNLAQKMKIDGGLISEYPMLTKPDKENFPRRNRLIAAFADVVIVIESAKKGGSFITAEFANNYSKDVFALPGKLTDPMSEGCNHLIKTHKAHMYTNVDDIAYINRWDVAPKSQQLSLIIELNDDEKNVLDIVKNKPYVGFDSIVYQSQIQLAKLSSILLSLEFKGFINSLPGKKFISK